MRREKCACLEPAEDRWEVAEEFDKVAIEFGPRVQEVESEVVAEEEETVTSC